MKSFARGAAAWLAMVGVVLVLQACGGGGSGGGTPNPPATPPPAAPSALSYTSPPTFTVGTAITALDPTVTGTVASYGVAPALPAGLALDTTTGRVSGTPTTPASSRAYTVTATNAGGNTTFALTFGVEQERATTDRTDEKTGRQVHVMYVLTSDAPDDKLDQLGTLEGSVRSWNTWFAAQTGGKELRLDTHSSGKLDVTFLRLARTDAQMSVAGGNVRNKVEYALLANGFDSVDKVYLVYYVGDGDGCGKSAWPPTLHGTVAAVYIGAAAGCTNQPFAEREQCARLPRVHGRARDAARARLCCRVRAASYGERPRRRQRRGRHVLRRAGVGTGDARRESRRLLRRRESGLPRSRE